MFDTAFYYKVIAIFNEEKTNSQDVLKTENE